MDKDNQEFEELIDQLVCTFVANGITDFDSLLKSLPGVYPSLVFDSIKRLIKAGKLSNQIFQIDLEKVNIASNENEVLFNNDYKANLPVPHPLDYDWRFSRTAVNYLLKLSLDLTESNEKIGFLGTPSLFLGAKRNFLPRQTILLDKNSAITNYLLKDNFKTDIISCDIVRDNIPNIKASVVVTDPPWYEAHLRGFMWVASKICLLGGKILISLPPIGTRPGIEKDLSRLFEWSKQLGLSLLRIERGILSYISPPFELNALKAENFNNFSKEWRHGDLAVFTKKEELSVKRPVVLIDLEENWVEEDILGVRIKLKPYESLDFTDPRLISIIKGDIFPGVSRRDTRRPLVDVWTSGNRVYACKGRFVLQQILRAVALNQPPIKFLTELTDRKLTEEEKLLVNKTDEQLSEIIETEREENLAFAD